MLGAVVGVGVGVPVVGVAVAPPLTVTVPFCAEAAICPPLESARRTLVKETLLVPEPLPLKEIVAYVPLPLTAP